MVLQTQRTYLREMDWGDLDALKLILQDPEVMYAYAHAFSQEEVAAWMDKQLSRYREDGFGLWAMVLKESGQMIGQCGLSWQEAAGRQVLEIGYLLQKAYWGHGYATEGARACKAYAFEVLGASQVYSIIRENNLPSIRVAQRNGMTCRGRIVKHYCGIDMPHFLYCATKPS